MGSCRLAWDVAVAGMAAAAAVALSGCETGGGELPSGDDAGEWGELDAAPEQTLASDAGRDEGDAAQDAPSAPPDGGALRPRELVGMYCSDDESWLFGERYPVIVWGHGVRREGWPSMPTETTLSVLWTEECGEPLHCTELHEQRVYALQVGEGWLELDGKRLTHSWRGTCPAEVKP